VVAAAVLIFELLPKRHMIVQTMPQAFVFWHDHPPQRSKIGPAGDPGSEAFFFLDLNTTGRAQNVIEQRISRTKYGFLWAAFTGPEGLAEFAKRDAVAYHLVSEGKLDRFPLADHPTLYGSWSLVDGRIQLAPFPSTRDTAGFRWDGSKFVTLSRAAEKDVKSEIKLKLNADDDEDEDPYSRFLSASTRQQFKAAGWHYKVLGYNPEMGTLPITLAGNTFNLTVENTPFSRDDYVAFDPVAYGPKSIVLSGDKLASSSQVLWESRGWQTISKAEYERLKQQGDYHEYHARWTWLLLLVAVVPLFLKWLPVLFKFGTVKRRVLSTMATSYSFPPATPAQFPSLDLDALDRYTREMERMGFTRLLDCSPTSDSPHSQPGFSRIFAHTRHHCWGVINQMFPRGRKPMPMRCGFESCLQNGWTLSFSNRKPVAVSSLVRRKKALAVSMPEATPSDLLQAFLKMREQVCLDLGISPLNDDSLEAYIRWIQRAAGEMRDAVEQKSFMRGLPEVYLRRFTLLKTKSEYVWLGDYPKEAERRKQGFGTFAADTR
jgi:hypothetical protein